MINLAQLKPSETFASPDKIKLLEALRLPKKKENQLNNNDNGPHKLSSATHTDREEVVLRWPEMAQVLTKVRPQDGTKQHRRLTYCGCLCRHSAAIVM
jgi:hypothetical protein